jgi:hypothetical protein
MPIKIVCHVIREENDEEDNEEGRQNTKPCLSSSTHPTNPPKQKQIEC